jgi:hypothetical protein
MLNLLFSVFENEISGYANFKSNYDYTQFITRMKKSMNIEDVATNM